MKRPAKYKIAFITWLAIYPLITIILFLFGKPLMEVPLYLRTLILTAILVPIMVYVAVPMLQSIFKPWLES